MAVECADIPSILFIFLFKRFLFLSGGLFLSFFCINKTFTIITEILKTDPFLEFFLLLRLLTVWLFRLFEYWAVTRISFYSFSPALIKWLYRFLCWRWFLKLNFITDIIERRNFRIDFWRFLNFRIIIISRVLSWSLELFKIISFTCFDLTLCILSFNLCSFFFIALLALKYSLENIDTIL